MPQGEIYVQFAGQPWIEINELLEEYPHLTYRGLILGNARFSFHGYTLYFPCRDRGEVIISKRPTQNCIEEHQAKCGPDYLPEIIPGEPGCLDMSYGRSERGVLYISTEQLQLLDKPWVSDGITPFEFEILFLLKEIARSGRSIDGELAYLRIKDMPFMETIEYGDLSILKGLASSRDVYLQRIVSHPSLRDGITDEWAKHFSVVRKIGVADRSESYRLSLLDTLFDPEQTLIEERTITLPLAGDVELAVVRPGVLASDAIGSPTMDMLEQAVRSQEEFMGVAFPQNHAILLVADLTRFGGTGGPDAIILTKYPENREIIVHETAHTYWTGGTDWLDEGGASFLSVISLRAYDGTPLPDSERPCTLFDNLYDLEVSELGFDVIYKSRCNYSLGRGILRELYNRLGDEAFRRGFGELYLALHNNSHGEACLDTDWSACYLRTSFLEGATPEQAAIVEDVLARRYYGSS